MNFQFNKKHIIFIILLFSLVPQAKTKYLNGSREKGEGFFQLITQNFLNLEGKYHWNDLSHSESEDAKYLNHNNSDKIKNYNILLAGLNTNKEELLIQSDIQSERENILYAEGDVSVSYQGKFLKANSLIYDKSKKKIIAKGNVSLIIGEQIFKLSELEYSFQAKKGF